jgi:hypothetical protein
MANANTPAAFKPVRNAGNGVMTGGLETFYVPATDATALYIGDPVVKAGSADAPALPRHPRHCGRGDYRHCRRLRPGRHDQPHGRLPRCFDPAYVLVCTDPGQLYEIQEDAVGGALAAVDVGLNADFIVAAATAYTKRSGVMLDTSTKATTATLPLKIMGFSQKPGNVIGANAKVLVKLNVNTEVAGAAGV